MVQYAPLSPARSATLDVSSLAAWSMDELRRISAAFSGVENILLPVLNVELDKPRDGMIILADGTNFNPGAGAGIYGRSAGAWVFLGGAAGSLPVLDTISIVEDPADTTKEMRIDVEAVASATVRVLTMPDQNIDLTPGTGSFPPTSRLISTGTGLTGGGSLAADRTHELDITGLASATVAEGDEIAIEDITAGAKRKVTAQAIADLAGAATLPVVDTTSIVEDPADTTKEMRIDVGAVAPSTVRVLTMPNQNIDLTPGTGTFPALSAANIWTANQTFANDVLIGTTTRRGKVTILIDDTSAALGESEALKVGVADGTEMGWTNNPAAGDFVVGYFYITSSGRNRIWGFNPIVDIESGDSATAYAIEVNINNARGSDAPNPRNAGHQIGIDAVSGGTYRPSAAFATLSTTLSNRWKYGIWFDNIGGSAGATLIKVNNNVDVDYGLDLQGGTFAHGAIRLPNGEDIRFRNAANSGDIAVLDLDNGNQLILGRGLVGGKLFLNVSGTIKVLSEGPVDSGGAGFKLLRVSN